MIRRSPPNASTSSYHSDSNTKLSPNHEHAAVTQRKRKRNDELERMENMMKEMKSMVTELVSNQNHQNQKMDSLQNALEDIRSQNSLISSQNEEIRIQNDEIRKTVTFLTEKYDDAMLQINTLQTKCNNNQKVIKTLEQKIDFMERNLKASSVEVKNLPSSKFESRETLIQSVLKVSNIVCQPLLETDIKNIFRLKSKDDSVGPVIVEFSSLKIKEELLKATRQFNKRNKDNRLNTNHIQNDGPKRPLYISEVLTTFTKRIYYLTREFIRSSDYEQCWTANGKVYVREKEGMPSRLIRNQEDLAKLRNQK